MIVPASISTAWYRAPDLDAGDTPDLGSVNSEIAPPERLHARRSSDPVVLVLTTMSRGPGDGCFDLAGGRASIDVYLSGDFDPGLLESERSIQSDAVRSAGKRVVVLCESGRSRSAALDLACRLVGDDGSGLTVVSVARQDPRICCGAGPAIDYNRAVCEAAAAELRQAQELLGHAGNRASFRLLVQDKDPPLPAWIAAGGFDVVVLPARRRPLRSAKHPAADLLRRSTSAEVRIVDARSSVVESRMENLRPPLTSSDPR